MEKQKLPNATTSLVLGICSIITCCCYGIIGLPLGIGAFITGQKAIKLNNQNSGEYEGVSNANIGKILGIIGIVFNLFVIAVIIYALYLVGWDAISNPELMQERMNELQNR
ncbi:CCC motif membrane protein [Tenacibaculum bernardetii]|uniref:CCC motif membrane protein n=1 Tax=Tenacibaculum bernardetii TaxID=3021375 RepID=UPI0023AED866|nr:CCC motif membrane protein [Tenacibaculum bernardetii]